MGRYPRWSVLILWIWATAGAAGDWQPDRWHHVTDTSPFHAKDRADLHGAAILQGDGSFALMVLGDAEDGALVSVNLPTSETVSDLTSTLVMPEGNILVRQADAAQLLATPADDGRSVTYSFAIAPGDIEQFMAAQAWRVQAGDTLTTISLDGSRVAIAAALEARDAGAGGDRTEP